MKKLIWILSLLISVVSFAQKGKELTKFSTVITAEALKSFEKHEDAWELGTGHNYSINEVFNMFKSKPMSREEKKELLNLLKNK